MVGEWTQMVSWKGGANTYQLDGQFDSCTILCKRDTNTQNNTRRRVRGNNKTPMTEAAHVKAWGLFLLFWFD
jgi:hypothetical protein